MCGFPTAAMPCSARIRLDTQNPEKYFGAHLWGADTSAAKDATLIFYNVDRDVEDKITDISFHFVAKPEFEASYVIL